MEIIVKAFLSDYKDFESGKHKALHFCRYFKTVLIDVKKCLIYEFFFFFAASANRKNYVSYFDKGHH